MSRLIAFLLFLAFSTTTAFAQPLNRATAAVNLKTAQDQEAKQDYYRALEYYDKYFEETKDYDVYPQMARLSMKLRDYKKAERYYGRYLKDSDDEEDEVEEEAKKDDDEDLNTFEYALKKGKEAVGKGKAVVKKKTKGKGKKKKRVKRQKLEQRKKHKRLSKMQEIKRRLLKEKWLVRKSGSESL